MDLRGLMKNRRSVRSFEDRPIPRATVDALLDAAVSAPSGGNIQPMSIIVVEEGVDRAALAKMVGNQPWVANAPVSLIFCIDFHRVKRWAQMFDVEFLGEQALASTMIAYADVMCAAQNVVILAESEGLGSVYIGTIQSGIGPARDYFGMPACVLPVMVLTLGYPKSVPRSIPKLAREEMVHRGRYRIPTDDEIRSAFESKYGSIDDDIDAYLERAYVEVVEADRQSDLEWTESAKRRFEKLEIRSNAAFLFDLRYPQRVMMGMNSRLLAALAGAGFRFRGCESSVMDGRAASVRR
jgi:nitroreductase